MSFPQSVKEKAMVACGRRCSICHKFCGLNMEVHHIIQEAEGGSNEFENAIPLCFDCHADVGHYNPKHPKGIKYSKVELREHRNNWYKKIETFPVIRNEPNNPKYIDMDTATFYELEKHLPFSVLKYLSELDFGTGKYSFGYLNDIQQFPNLSRFPQYEFLDMDLECAKADLSGSIEDFFASSLPYLHSDDAKWVMIPRDWKYKNPESYFHGVEILNHASTKIWKNYCSYISLCRRKLEVNVKL